jgi:16S rRNA (cytidine1402-2'-O)-methyltransferase
MPDPGKVILIASPLGNLGDLSIRATEALQQCDFCIAEDTRVSAKLLQHVGVKKPLAVLNEHTQAGKIQQYLDRVAAGETAVVLSDGGTPCISDPGAIFVDLARERDIEVDAIPGPSAVTQALMLSGFFAQRFVFLGFLGRKPGDIRRDLEAYVDSTLTIVLFESPYRVEALCRVAAEALPGRRVAICRELTKLHQQVVVTTLEEFPTESVMPRLGEFTVVIEGKRRQPRN